MALNFSKTSTPQLPGSLPAIGFPLRMVMAAALLGLLVFELRSGEDLSVTTEVLLRQLGTANPFWLMATVLLMPFNWLAETYKWRQFLGRHERMSLVRALQAVWAGVAISLFTPNRVGEYGGRLFFVKAENRWRAVAANLVGNFSQYLVLLTAGSAGFFLFAQQQLEVGKSWLGLYLMIALPGLALIHLFYFNLQASATKASRWRLLSSGKRFVKMIGLAGLFPRKELARLLAWAWLRYAIYAAQYFLLLQFCGIPVSLGEGFVGISTLFLLQTSIPLPPLTGLAVRGNLSIWMWQQFGASAVNSLAATYMLWIINLILPAFFGAFSIFFAQKAEKSTS